MIYCYGCRRVADRHDRHGDGRRLRYSHNQRSGPDSSSRRSGLLLRLQILQVDRVLLYKDKDRLSTPTVCLCGVNCFTYCRDAASNTRLSRGNPTCSVKSLLVFTWVVQLLQYCEAVDWATLRAYGLWNWKL